MIINVSYRLEMKPEPDAPWEPFMGLGDVGENRHAIIAAVREDYPGKEHPHSEWHWVKITEEVLDE